MYAHPADSLSILASTVCNAEEELQRKFGLESVKNMVQNIQKLMDGNFEKYYGLLNADVPMDLKLAFIVALGK